MPTNPPLEVQHYQTIISVIGVVVGLLITILIAQINSVKNALSNTARDLFNKIDALVDKKVSKDECKEFRDICFRDCPYRRKEEKRSA